MATTYPYTTFNAECFADTAQQRAWLNLQHELYRNLPGNASHVKFLRDAGEGTLVAEILDDEHLLVRATLRPFHGGLKVEVFGPKQVTAVANFDGWELPSVFLAVTSFITRTAER